MQLEQERRKRARLTAPVGVKPLHPCQDFICWRDCLEQKALAGDHDAVLLLGIIDMKLAAHDPERKLSDPQAEGLVHVLLRLAQEHRDMGAVDMLRDIVSLYSRAGRPLPISLRDFDPSDYRKKTGPADPFEHYRTIARRIYEYRKGQGCFPAKKWDIWDLSLHLGKKIDAQIATDKGVSNQLEKLANTKEFPWSASKLKQAYLGDTTRKIRPLRRHFVIEDMADYCLNYWAVRFTETP